MNVKVVHTKLDLDRMGLATEFNLILEPLPILFMLITPQNKAQLKLISLFVFVSLESKFGNGDFLLRQ